MTANWGRNPEDENSEVGVDAGNLIPSSSGRWAASQSPSSGRRELRCPASWKAPEPSLGLYRQSLGQLAALPFFPSPFLDSLG